MAVAGNSLESELEDFELAFEQVRQVADDYHAQEVGAKDKLYDALSEVFRFGEDLAKRPDHEGQAVLDAFLVKKNATKTARKNPYLPLVKLAFGNLSASSASQYAVVLKHAHFEKLPVGSFRAWLSESGIKDRHKAAVQHFGGNGHLRSEERKLSRLAAGKAEADKLSISDPFKFTEFQGTGYATVLVRIDETGQAVVVDRLDADVDALLRRYAPKGADKHPLTNRPLFSFFRAIDLVVRLTPDKPQGQARDILISRERLLGADVVRVQSISAAYSSSWASMVIAGDVPGLPPGDFVLSGDDAAQFCKSFEMSDWSIIPSGDVATLINVPAVSAPLVLSRLSGVSPLYVASAFSQTTQQIALDHSYARGFARGWADYRERNQKRNKSRPQPKSLPTELAFSLADDVASVGPLDEPVRFKLLDAPGWHLSSGERWLAVADLERLCGSADHYEIDMAGSVVGGHSPELGIRLHADCGADRLTVVIPFVIGRGGQLAQTNEKLPLS